MRIVLGIIVVASTAAPLLAQKTLPQMAEKPLPAQQLAEKPLPPPPTAAKPAVPHQITEKAPPPALQAAARPAAQPPAAADKKPAASDAAADDYTYHVDGRRDPFLNLLGTGPEPRPVGRRPDGIAGLTLGDISVRGVMQSRDSLVAMIAGPDNKTYVVHPGDRLLDGTITNIMRDGLVVTQRVSDPLSTVKQREVRKLLRSLEDAKE
jgi:Tfp pilus assembly protein PilP